MSCERVLQCRSGKFGVAVDAKGIYRVRCRGKFCKAPDGKLTFHIFDLTSGVLLRTEHQSYRSPSELLGIDQVKESA